MRKTKSAILEAVHETAKGLHAAGVMKQVTLREFDRLCLPPVEPLSPGKIRKIRVQSHVSQAVFAALLNTQCLYRAEVGNRSEAPHRNRAEVAPPRAEAWSRSRRVA